MGFGIKESSPNSDNVPDVDSAKDLMTGIGHGIPAKIPLNPSAPVLKMTESGFPEMVEAHQTPGHGNPLLEVFQFLFASIPIRSKHISDRMADLEAIGVGREPLFF
jgi:hypothetical protein